MLVKRVWGEGVACITAALLTVSPVVIFYVRIMRPYAPAMLLATSSLLLTMIWMKGGRRKDLLLSALCGSLAMYYHLYTAIPVGVPFLVALVAVVKPVGQRLGLFLASKRPFGDLLIAGSIMVVIDGVFVVIPNVLNPWWSHGIHNMDHANLQTAVTVLSLISGTRNPVLMAAILGLLLSGLALMIYRSRIMGISIAISFLIFFTIMANTTQDGAHAGIQVARYGLTFFPLSFMAIALALASIGEFLRTKFLLFQRKHLLFGFALLAWSPFLVTSPLWTTYVAPNNFTNHSAYQYRYDPILWLQRSPERDLVPGVSMDYQGIPNFYFQSPLLKTAKGVIEYPMLIGDQLNLHYYFQHFHKLPVVAGYVTNNIYAPIRPGSDFVNGDWPIDSVMAGMPEPLRKKTSWRTMVDLNDSAELRNRFKGWVVVIHRDPFGELFLRDPPDNRTLVSLVGSMNKTFGTPGFVDEKIAAWLIE
jgi:hypothetical protein